MKQNTQKRITQLDGMRGIFALMVLLLHFPVATYLTNNFVVRQSYLFVDFFFVLSGFIITTNYIDKIDNRADFKAYFLKRLVRLYPLLFFTVILYFLYLMVGEFVLSGLKEGHQPISTYLQELLDSLLFLNSTPIFGTSQGVNPPSWSISAEIISYIIFGLGILYFKQYRLWFSLIVIALCVSFMLYSNSYAFKNGDYGFVRGLLGFNFGVLTYLLSTKHTVKSAIFQFPLVVLLILAFFMVDQIKIELLKLVFPPLFSVLIFVFLIEKGFLNKFLFTKVIQFLGRISYSLYLNHYLLLMVLYIVFFRILSLPITEPYSTLILLISIIITVIYSHFTHIFIEQGVGKFLNKIIFDRKADRARL